MNQKDNEPFAKKCQVTGWILFVISSIFFMMTSLRAEDIVGFLGGLFFFVACIIFLLPFKKA